MANLSFLDAIGEMQRRSAISGRPAEKNAMDKLLRDNAIRRLSTRGIDAVNPVIEEKPFMRESDMTPQGIEPGEPVTGAPDVPTTAAVNPNPGQIVSNALSVVDASKGALPALAQTVLGKVKGQTPFTEKAVNFLINKIAGTHYGEVDPYSSPEVQSVLNMSYPEPEQTQSFDVEPQQSLNPPDVNVNANVAAWSAPPPTTQTITTNVIGNQPAGYEPGGGGPSAGDTVLCGELYRQGKLDWQTYLADSAYGQTLSPEVMAGYQVWAIPLSHRMARSHLLSSIVSPFVKAWAYEMAYRMGKRSHGTVTGKIMSFFGEPICGLIGRSLEWHSIKLSQTH